MDFPLAPLYQNFVFQVQTSTRKDRPRAQFWFPQSNAQPSILCATGHIDKETPHENRVDSDAGLAQYGLLIRRFTEC
jgi:hypothetical protein